MRINPNRIDVSFTVEDLDAVLVMTGASRVHPPQSTENHIVRKLESALGQLRARQNGITSVRPSPGQCRNAVC